MAVEMLSPGLVIRYPYLWKREHDRGETEGRKDRPVCLAISLAMKGDTYLYLLPISSQQPAAGQTADLGQLVFRYSRFSPWKFLFPLFFLSRSRSRFVGDEYYRRRDAHEL